jgi:hypothetical protein
VDLGVSGIKPAGEGVWVLWRGCARDNRSGIRDRDQLLSVSLLHGFRSLGVGVLLDLGGYELAPV